MKDTGNWEKILKTVNRHKVQEKIWEKKALTRTNIGNNW